MFAKILVKQHSGTEIYYDLESSTYDPFKYRMDNVMNMHGTIHQN